MISSESGLKIITIHHEEAAKEWCWPESISNKVESIYSLLSKFAYFNALGCADLRMLFRVKLRRNAASKGVASASDLRSNEFFDVKALSRILRLDEDNLLKSFVLYSFPNATFKSARHLVWCPECIERGLHLPFHQLEYIGACPLHGVGLRRQCATCGHQIPYELSDSVFRDPFCCPNCRTQLFSIGSASHRSDPPLTESEVQRADAISLNIQREDRLMTLAYEFDRISRLGGQSRFGTSRSDHYTCHGDYSEFVLDVMDTLKRGQIDQKRLTFVGATVVARNSPPLIKKFSDKFVERNYRRGRVKEKAGFEWEMRIDKLKDVYKAYRRHVWRHLLAQHRKCVFAVTQALWWNTEGDRTEALCPIALGFIRWRMGWEGVAIPRELFGSSKQRLSGLVSWNGSSMTTVGFSWSDDALDWIMQHAFMLSIASRLVQCLEEANNANESGALKWLRLDFSCCSGKKWAVTGSDTKMRPLLFFSELKVRGTPTADSLMYKATKRHVLDVAIKARGIRH